VESPCAFLHSRRPPPVFAPLSRRLLVPMLVCRDWNHGGCVMATAGRNYRDMDTDELYQLAAYKGIMNVSSNDREALIRSLENREGDGDTESSRLEGKDMEELLAIAEKRGVRNRNELPKTQLISAILTAGDDDGADERP